MPSAHSSTLLKVNSSPINFLNTKESHIDSFAFGSFVHVIKGHQGEITSVALVPTWDNEHHLGLNKYGTPLIIKRQLNGYERIFIDMITLSDMFMKIPIDDWIDAGTRHSNNMTRHKQNDHVFC